MFWNDDPSPRCPRILIVDDDVGVLSLLRTVLTEDEGMEVFATPSAMYGFELALRATFDLFLFDVDMPILKGPLLYTLLGKVYEARGTLAEMAPPLLLMSARAGERELTGLLREPGVRGVIAKPFRTGHLLSKVRESLGILQSAA